MIRGQNWAASRYRSRIVAALLGAGVVAVLLWAFALGGATESRASSNTIDDGSLLAKAAAQSQADQSSPRTLAVPPAPAAPSGSIATGDVSWADYEAAVNATVQCFQDSGLAMRTMPAPDASGLVLRYTVWLTGDAVQDARISAVTAECEGRNLTSIRMKWAEQLKPTAAQIESARTSMAECLTSGGVSAELIDSDRLLDAQAISPGTLYPDCANQVARQFGIPSFGG